MIRPKQPELRELWRRRIAQQKASGQSIHAFCRDQTLSENSFYAWRKKLGGTMDKDKPVRFALVETTTMSTTGAPRHAMEPLELMLSSGDRIRIPADAATLRLVLSVLENKPA